MVNTFDERRIAALCKAMGDANRLKIVRILTGGERCACKLFEELNITQPTLSHHMKILCECGLVVARRDGKWIHFSLDCTTLCQFRAYIGGLICEKGCREE